MKQPNEDLAGGNGNGTVAAKKPAAVRRRHASDRNYEVNQVTLNTIQGVALNQEAQLVRRLTTRITHIQKRQQLHRNLVILLTLLALTELFAAIYVPIGILGWTKAASVYIQLIAGLALGAGGGLAGYFARFFAQCYRADQAEEQNVTNELTTLEPKYAALSCALALGKAEPIKHALRALSDTERNFLRSGQSTVELEKSKLAQKSEKKMESGKRQTARKGTHSK